MALIPARPSSPRTRLRKNAMALLALGAVGVAGLLATISVALRGNVLMSLATVFATLWAAVLTWTVFRTGNKLRHLARQLGPVPARLNQLSAPAPSDPAEVEATVPGPPPAPLPPVPPPPVPPTAGHRPSRMLWEMTTAGTGAGGPSRRIGVIGSPTLRAAVEAHGEVHSLDPVTSLLELEHQGIRTVVIEEDALHDGAWAGALDAHGTPLLRELLALTTHVQARDGMVYLLPTRGVPGVSATALRDATTLVTADQQTPGPSLLGTLARHLEQVTP